VTLRRFRATVVVVEKQLVLQIPRVCVYSLSYMARKAQAPYYRLWPLRLYYIFPHYIIKVTILYF
jgi:hypothetical protein